MEPNQTSGPGTSGPHWPPQTHSRSLSDTRIRVFDSIKTLVFLSLVNLVFALAKFTLEPGFSLCLKLRVVNVQLLCLFSSTFHENTLHKSRHYLSKHLTRKTRLWRNWRNVCSVLPRYQVCQEWTTRIQKQSIDLQWKVEIRCIHLRSVMHGGSAKK